MGTYHCHQRAHISSLLMYFYINAPGDCVDIIHCDGLPVGVKNPGRSQAQFHRCAQVRNTSHFFSCFFFFLSSCLAW